MFRKLRRRLAQRSIRKFLKDFMPNVDLGNVYLFECEDFRLGQYAVHTNKGKYKLTFWELVSGAKEFTLELNCKEGEGEFIIFSIHGNVSFTIMPETLTIDRKGVRQVVDLVNGSAKVYPKGPESDKVNYKVIEYRKPIMASEVISIDQLVKITCSYIF